MNRENEHPTRAGDKVVCVDATPLPNFAPRGAEMSEFTFPDGYIEEGAIYCIERVFEYRPGVYGYYLVGKRFFYQGREFGWFSGRFRPVDHKDETEKTTSAGKVEKSSHR